MSQFTEFVIFVCIFSEKADIFFTKISMLNKLQYISFLFLFYFLLQKNGG